MTSINIAVQRVKLCKTTIGCTLMGSSWYFLFDGSTTLRGKKSREKPWKVQGKPRTTRGKTRENQGKTMENYRKTKENQGKPRKPWKTQISLGGKPLMDQGRSPLSCLAHLRQTTCELCMKGCKPMAWLRSAVNLV